jgi:LDH2 family malate/lactate/ureidoglycolate dehydrogenase
MNLQAKGAFTVKTTPQAWSETPQGSVSDHSLGRFLLDKQYHGDLEGTAEGQMLTAGSPQKGSAAYVAVERVTGTLQGRKGSFMLTHSGTMNKGDLHLLITIVPDSGTDELAGIAGTLTIQIVDGKHNYELAYTLSTMQ